jgi:hypothetical protein
VWWWHFSVVFCNFESFHGLQVRLKCWEIITGPHSAETGITASSIRKQVWKEWNLSGLCRFQWVEWEPTKLPFQNLLSLAVSYDTSDITYIQVGVVENIQRCHLSPSLSHRDARTHAHTHVQAQRILRWQTLLANDLYKYYTSRAGMSFLPCQWLADASVPQNLPLVAQW